MRRASAAVVQCESVQMTRQLAHDTDELIHVSGPKLKTHCLFRSAE